MNIRRFRSNFAINLPRWRKALLGLGALTAIASYSGAFNYLDNVWRTPSAESLRGSVAAPDQEKANIIQGNYELKARQLGDDVKNTYKPINTKNYSRKYVDNGNYMLESMGSGVNAKYNLIDRNDPTKVMSMSVSSDHRKLEAIITQPALSNKFDLNKMMKIGSSVAALEKLSFSVPTAYKDYGVKYIDISKTTNSRNEIVATTDDIIKQLKGHGLNSFRVIPQSEVEQRGISLNNVDSKKVQEEAADNTKIKTTDFGQDLDQVEGIRQQYKDYVSEHKLQDAPSL